MKNFLQSKHQQKITEVNHILPSKRKPLAS